MIFTKRTYRAAFNRHRRASKRTIPYEWSRHHRIALRIAWRARQAGVSL